MSWTGILTGTLALSLTLTFTPAKVTATSGSCTTASTFNAALLHQVSDYVEREQRIAGGLVETDSDFYCMQEMWLESDVERLIDDVWSVYPHHYSPIHHRADTLRKPTHEMTWAEYWDSFEITSPCSITDGVYFGSLLASCGRKHGCLGLLSTDSKQGARCLAQHCSKKLKSDWLHPYCIQCIVLMFSDFSSALEACAPDIFEVNNRLNAAGLMLLSKYPIENARYVNFHQGKEMAVERGYLEAEIRGVKVVCTHFASIDGTFIEYDNLTFSDYLTQNALEINQTIDTFSGQGHLLMGDFNTGPEVEDLFDEEKNLTGEFPENYQLIKNAGYQAPYFNLDGRCTYCDTNPLRNSSYSNLVIDNIVLKGLSGYTVDSARRIMDPLEPYSDHYGMELTICPAF